MQDLLGTCTRYVPFLARFLHNLAHILQEMVQDFARDAARTITCKFAHFLQDLARIGARLCKNRARKGTYRVHVPSKSCMQDSCTILHDLASSFLLGTFLLSGICVKPCESADSIDKMTQGA